MKSVQMARGMARCRCRRWVGAKQYVVTLPGLFGESQRQALMIGPVAFEQLKRECVTHHMPFGSSEILRDGSSTLFGMDIMVRPELDAHFADAGFLLRPWANRYLRRKGADRR